MQAFSRLPAIALTNIGFGNTGESGGAHGAVGATGFGFAIRGDALPSFSYWMPICSTVTLTTDRFEKPGWATGHRNCAQLRENCTQRAPKCLHLRRARHIIFLHHATSAYPESALYKEA